MALTKSSSLASLNKDPEVYAADLDADVADVIRSINRGFRPEQYTTTERDALTNLWKGRIIYNTTTNKLNVYTTAWEAITSA